MESVPNGNVKKKTTKKGKVQTCTRARKEKQKFRRETKRKCACSAKSCNNVIGQELTLAFLHCLTFAYSLVAESEHACACVCEFARACVCVCVCVCVCACVRARACACARVRVVSQSLSQLFFLYLTCTIC